MFKFVISSVLAAAAIAAALTILTERLDAGTVAAVVPLQVNDTPQGCTQQPWPYLNCIGAAPSIRLITTERLGA